MMGLGEELTERVTLFPGSSFPTSRKGGFYDRAGAKKRRSCNIYFGKGYSTYLSKLVLRSLGRDINIHLAGNLEARLSREGTIRSIVYPSYSLIL